IQQLLAAYSAKDPVLIIHHGYSCQADQLLYIDGLCPGHYLPSNLIGGQGMDGNVSGQNHYPLARILIDADRHVHYSSQKDCQWREVFGVHRSDIGHLQIVDYVLAGDVTYQADSRESLYQNRVFDSELLFKDDLDNILLHE